MLYLLRQLFFLSLLRFPDFALRTFQGNSRFYFFSAMHRFLPCTIRQLYIQRGDENTNKHHSITSCQCLNRKAHRKFSSQFQMNEGQQVVRQLGKSLAQWFKLNEVIISDCYCGILIENIFVRSIVNNYKEWMSFSEFMEKEWERGTNKSPGNHLLLTRFVCPALRLIPHEIRKERHSFLK